MRSLLGLALLGARRPLAGCAGHPGARRRRRRRRRDGHAITDDGHGNYTITLDRFTVAPGAERYACQDFANPFGGASAAIHAFASHLTPGSHHLLVFYKPSAPPTARSPTAAAPSSPPGPYGSQRPDDALTFPDGVAAVVAPSDGFRVQAHYLNATPAPLDGHRHGHARAASTAPPCTIAPPSSSSPTAPSTCPPAPAASWRRRAARCRSPSTSCRPPATCTRTAAPLPPPPAARPSSRAAATATSTPALFDPPLALPAGTVVTFACTYDNSDGTTPLVFGDSALTDEMCIFTAQFFPAPFGGFTCS